MMIKPTVGRVVWFWPNGFSRSGFRNMGNQPCAAQIAYVHDERNVNLVVTDHDGVQWPVPTVQLVQEEDTKPLGTFCEWMPYQKGQAARTDAAEAAVAKA